MTTTTGPKTFATTLPISALSKTTIQLRDGVGRSTGLNLHAIDTVLPWRVTGTAQEDAYVRYVAVYAAVADNGRADQINRVFTGTPLRSEAQELLPASSDQVLFMVGSALLSLAETWAVGLPSFDAPQRRMVYRAFGWAEAALGAIAFPSELTGLAVGAIEARRAAARTGRCYMHNLHYATEDAIADVATSWEAAQTWLTPAQSSTIPLPATDLLPRAKLVATFIARHGAPHVAVVRTILPSSSTSASSKVTTVATERPTPVQRAMQVLGVLLQGGLEKPGADAVLKAWCDWVYPIIDVYGRNEYAALRSFGVDRTSSDFVTYAVALALHVVASAEQEKIRGEGEKPYLATCAAALLTLRLLSTVRKTSANDRWVSELERAAQTMPRAAQERLQQHETTRQAHAREGAREELEAVRSAVASVARDADIAMRTRRAAALANEGYDVFSSEFLEAIRGIPEAPYVSSFGPFWPDWREEDLRSRLHAFALCLKRGQY